MPDKSIEHDETTGDKKKEAFWHSKSFKLVLEVCAIIVPSIFLFLQLRATQSTTRQANDVERVRSMPVVSMAGFTVIPNFGRDTNGMYDLRYYWKNFGETRAVDVSLEWGYSSESPTKSSPYSQPIETSAMPKDTGPYSDMVVPVGEFDRLRDEESFVFVYAKNIYSDLLCTDSGDKWSEQTGHCTDPRKHVHIRKTCVRISKFNPKDMSFTIGICPQNPDCDDYACGDDYQQIQWKIEKRPVN